MEQLKTGPKEPLMMTGPKFGEGGGWLSKFNRWLKRNRQQITLVIIGVLIIAGGVYLYSNYQKTQLIGPGEEISQEEQEEGIVKPEQIKIEEQTTPSSETQPSQSPERAQIVKTESNKITVKAEKGAGVTHLARAALKQYLEQNPESKANITAEHKIYIEDYLKDKTGSFPLNLGQELSFDENLIEEAIDASGNLTQKQLENLHQYVLLVPSLSG